MRKFIRIGLFALLSLLWAVAAQAQVFPITGTVQDNQGHVVPATTVIVLSGTTATVNTTTQPGSPLATIYSDPAGTQAINQSTNPAQTDGHGNFAVYAAAGNYVVQAYLRSGQQYVWPVSVGGSGGGMTWPGTAGIANYNGVTWGTSYNGANLIPENFFSPVKNVNPSTCLESDDSTGAALFKACDSGAGDPNVYGVLFNQGVTSYDQIAAMPANAAVSGTNQNAPGIGQVGYFYNAGSQSEEFAGLFNVGTGTNPDFTEDFNFKPYGTFAGSPGNLYVKFDACSGYPTCTTLLPVHLSLPNTGSDVTAPAYTMTAGPFNMPQSGGNCNFGSPATTYWQECVNGTDLQWEHPNSGGSGRFHVDSDLLVGPPGQATSGTNFNSFAFDNQGEWWNGSSSQYVLWEMTNSVSPDSGSPINTRENFYPIFQSTCTGCTADLSIGGTGVNGSVGNPVIPYWVFEGYPNPDTFTMTFQHSVLTQSVAGTPVIFTGAWVAGDCPVGSATPGLFNLSACGSGGTLALNDADIFVGNSSNIATDVTPSGDISLTDTGLFGVIGIQGHGVPSPTSGFLQWTGSALAWGTPTGTLPSTPTSPNNATAILACAISSSTCTPAWSFGGVVPRHVSGATSTDTITTADGNGNTVVYDGSVAVATSVPTPTSLGLANPFFVTSNFTTGSSTAVTFTATTDNFRSTGTTSLVMLQGQTCTITFDSVNSVWDDVCKDGPLSAGSGVTLTRTKAGVAVASSGGFTPYTASQSGLASTATGYQSVTLVSTTQNASGGFYLVQVAVSVTTASSGCSSSASDKPEVQWTDANNSTVEGFQGAAVAPTSLANGQTVGSFAVPVFAKAGTAVTVGINVNTAEAGCTTNSAISTTARAISE